MAKLNFVAIPLQTLALALEIIIVTLVIWIGYQQHERFEDLDEDLFIWHIVMMALGTFIFLAQTLTVHHWIPASPGVLRVIHAFSGIMWLGFCGAGFGLIVQAKEDAGDDHFGNSHERIGLVVFVLSFFQSLFGIAKAVGLLATDNKTKIMRWHGKLGVLIFVLALVAIGTGLALTGEELEGADSSEAEGEEEEEGGEAADVDLTDEPTKQRIKRQAVDQTEKEEDKSEVEDKGDKSEAEDEEDKSEAEDGDGDEEGGEEGEEGEEPFLDDEETKTIVVYCLMVILSVIVVFFADWAALGAEEKEDKYAAS